MIITDDKGPHGHPVTTAGVTPGRDSNLGGVSRAAYFRVRDGGNISKIRLRIGTSSGNIAVAVYRNSGSGSAATPGARAATSGVVACPAAGSAEVALTASVDVNPGDWLCIWVDNTTVTFGLNGDSATIYTGATGPAQLQGSLASGPPATAAATHHVYYAASLVGISG